MCGPKPPLGQEEVCRKLSMPLLRAVDVRAFLVSAAAVTGFLSQCPCCGRSMCGLLVRLRSNMFGLSQCPCCGRSMCGDAHRSRAGRSDPLVSMPLLRAVDVRDSKSSRSMIGRQSTCLNALVAGGRCAGSQRDKEAQGASSVVSMPLLRAVDVRAHCNDENVCTLDACVSQCPCCGRSMCGLQPVPKQGEHHHGCLNALVAGGRCAGPFQPAAPKGAAEGLSQCPCCGRSMCGRPRSFSSTSPSPTCLNALVAGGRCAGSEHPTVQRGKAPRLSQCPCCGRSMCGWTCPARPASICHRCLNALVAGGRCAGTREVSRASRSRLPVSMPLLRAVDVRAWTPCNACKYLVTTCLNALVAGGRCAGFRGSHVLGGLPS